MTNKNRRSNKNSISTPHRKTVKIQIRQSSRDVVSFADKNRYEKKNKTAHTLNEYYARHCFFTKGSIDKSLWVVYDNLKNYWEKNYIFHNCLYARLQFDLLLLALNMKVQQKKFFFKKIERVPLKAKSCPREGSERKFFLKSEALNWGWGWDKWGKFYRQKKRKRGKQSIRLIFFLPFSRERRSFVAFRYIHCIVISAIYAPKKVNIPKTSQLFCACVRSWTLYTILMLL